MVTKEVSLLTEFASRFTAHAPEEMTLDEYLDLCKTDPMCYASAAQRMIDAIGEPTIFNTALDQRFSRLFGNREIRRYKAFEGFYGMEETIESIVDFFLHAAQGLEEAKQVLYLLGPVGGGKSSLVMKIRQLMESRPIYVLAYKRKLSEPAEMSPYFSRVLPLFSSVGLDEAVSKQYNIPINSMKGIIGPWERNRLNECNGDLSMFRVIKVYPSRIQQIAVSEAEPGDENTQDISTLVGKVDMRKLEDLKTNDPDAYLYSGALNQGNQGLFEFKEMFKAKIKMLGPLLFAVQEHNYQGTETIGAMPFHGIVVAHSNESEWTKFKNNKDNEAFLDRICIVKVPYCLRWDEEIEIYKKAIAESELANHPIAPGTLEVLALFSVISRIKEPQNGSWYSKAKVYNGENMREKDPHAKSYHDYKEDSANRTEGHDAAISTRWAFKRLSQCFNADPHEVAADAIYMMNILLDEVKHDLSPEQEATYVKVIKDIIEALYYYPLIDREIRSAYIESYTDYGQTLFDKYVMWADKFINDEEYHDPNTGTTLNKEKLNLELEKIEKPAEISNPRDFRNEIVNYVLRYQAKNNQKNPPWRSYEKLKEVIEKTMFSNTQDLLPVISFGKKANTEDEKKHAGFNDRMKEKGYTQRQIERVVDWYIRSQKAS